MSVNACIVRVTLDNKILLVKHHERGWEFPGGKIDPSKDRFKDTQVIDLLHTATREFQEEVSEQIGCMGSPSNVLYEQEYRTVFFVYKDQQCVFDCFDKYKEFLSKDDAIEQIQQFKLDEIVDIKFSFESDKQLIKAIL